MKRSHQTAISLAITLAALGWLAIANDWSEVWGHLEHLALWPFAVTTLLIVIQFYLRGLRWKFLLPRGTEMNVGSATNGVILGNFANYILPLRAGELVRVLFVKGKAGVPFGTGAVSVLTERVLDVVSVLVAFAIATARIEEVDPQVVNGALTLGAVALAIALGLFAAAFMPRIVRGIAEPFIAFLPEKLESLARQTMNSVIEGAKALRDRRNFFGSLLSSAAVWLVTFEIYYLYLFLFPEAQALFLYGVLASVLIGLAIAIPSAPGGVGVYQLGCIAALTMGPYDRELATAYALVTHFHQYLVIVGAGLIVLTKENLSIGKLRSGQAGSAA